MIYFLFVFLSPNLSLSNSMVFKTNEKHRIPAGSSQIAQDVVRSQELAEQSSFIASQTADNKPFAPPSLNNMLIIRCLSHLHTLLY